VAALAAERVDGVRRVITELEVTPPRGEEASATPLAVTAFGSVRPFPEAIDRVLNLEALVFERGSAALTERDREILDELAKILGVWAEWDVEISGAGSGGGGEPFDEPLSLARADAVRDYLARTLDAGRISMVERAPRRLVGGSEPHRKIEFRLIERPAEASR
jgi:outer membrane protein OmpA-like peptidoglycan-associated protein